MSPAFSLGEAEGAASAEPPNTSSTISQSLLPAAAPPGAAAALVAMPKEGVSLAPVRAVEPRSEPAEQSGVLGFFSPRKRGAAPTTEPTAVFELVGARRDHGVFDAHATALAGGWVAALKEQLGGSGPLPQARRASQLVSGDV